MPYVTSIERMAEARGKAEGRLFSKIETLLLLLETRFGVVDSNLATMIQAIETEELLTLLHKQVVLAATIDEFTEFFEKHRA